MHTMYIICTLLITYRFKLQAQASKLASTLRQSSHNCHQYNNNHHHLLPHGYK